MKYVIKLTLEQDGELEKEWAIGCILPDGPSEHELEDARRELFECAKVQLELLLRLDYFGCSVDMLHNDVTL